jgi:P-type conjugative transfer protein TrbJ
MKRVLLASAILLGTTYAADRPTHAMIVECANCSTIAEELLSDAKQAQQYLTQVASLQTELNQYANMVTNTVALPQEIWANVQGDIMQVRSLANAASLLTGNSGSMLTRLQSAQGYASSASFLPQNIGSQLTMWQQTIANAGTSLGRTLGVQQGQEQNYTALQAAIQAHSQTAAGQMQAIQAGNESLGLMNTQLQQLQTTLTTAAQATATHDLVAADRQAAEDAQYQQLFANPAPYPTTGNPTVRFQ